MNEETEELTVDTATFEMRFAHGLYLILQKAAELQGGVVNPLVLEVAWATFITSVFEQFGLKVPTKEDIAQLKLLMSASAAKGVN